jgi:hypothetical protein
MAHPELGIAYPKLADPATYIRLLTIVADPTEAPQTDRVRILIHATPFNLTPLYHAVSYTWGSPSEKEEITVVGVEGCKREILNGKRKGTYKTITWKDFNA